MVTEDPNSVPTHGPVEHVSQRRFDLERRDYAGRNASAASFWSGLRRLATGGAVWPVTVLIWISATTLTMAAARNVRAKRDLTIPEGSIVYSIQSLSLNQPLYRDYRHPPYATTPYPPVYYAVVAASVALLRTDSDIELVYVAGRLCTLMAAVFSLFLSIRLTSEIDGPRAWAPATALLALTCPSFVLWGFTCRPDFLALALSLSGFACLVSRPNLGRIIAASLFFLGAVYTKQSFVSAPAAILASYVLERRWRVAAALIFFLVAGGTIVFAVIDRITHGLFSENVIGANIAPIQWRQLPVLVFFFLFVEGAWLLLFGLLGLTTQPRRRGVGGLALTLYLVFATAVAVITTAKAGSDRNYFIEPIVVASILGSRGAKRLEAIVRHYPRLALPVPLLLIALAVYTERHALDVCTPMFTLPTGSKQVLGRIERIDGDVLFADSGLAVRSGRPIQLLDNFNASYLADAGRIDFAPLIRRLERGEIGAVVLDHQTPFATAWGRFWWPRGVAIAIDRNYEFERAVGGKYFFLPRYSRSQ
jgi:hypothetical protein